MIGIKLHKKNSSIVMMSRVRLARNVMGYRFSNAAAPDELAKVFDACFKSLSKVRKFQDGEFVKMSEISEFGRGILIENRIASRELPSGSPASGVYYSKDMSVSAMINEEDHLRIQSVGKGQCLKSLWKTLNSVDNSVEKNLEYLFSAEVGYLTACPSNVGTGMRASLMMHLPALVMSEQIEKIIRGLNQLGMVARGADGEGSDSYGAFFQLSNQQTLGVSENDIIEKIIKFGDKLSDFEINARLKLFQETPIILADKFARALSILRNCKLIDTAEAMSHLSSIRLAADMGFIRGASKLIEDIDSTMLDIKPAHLQKKFNIRESEATERDKIRAAFLNQFATQIPEPKMI